MMSAQRAAAARRRAELLTAVLALVLAMAAAGAASAAAATVSGFVRTAAGDPVPGVTLSLGPAIVETDADGAYALEVDPGSYTLDGLMQVGGEALGLPEDWSFFGPLTVGGDRTFDIRLPVARTLTISVLGAGDAPLEGARIELPSFDYGTRVSLGGEPGFRISANPHAALTDAAGEYATRVFDGTGPHLGAQGQMTQPDNSDYLPTSFGLPTVSGDTTVVVHASQPSAHVTGTLRDGDGDPIPGVPLTLGPARDVTAADGSYSLGVNPGRYTFTASAPDDSGALGLPDSWFLSGPLRVTADRTFDVALPDVVTLTTRALDGANGDAPLEGALVDLPGWDLRGIAIGGETEFRLNASAAQGTTDAAGEAHALLFDDAEPHFGQPVTVTPPESTGYAPVESVLPDLDGDKTVVVRAPEPFYWVTGAIRDDLGTPLEGVSVDVGSDTATTGADGAYRVRVEPGGNGLNLAMPGAEAVGLPPNWTLTGNFTAVSDRTLDVTLPKALHVTTRILGDEDEPVPGTRISIPRFSFWFPLDTFGELRNVQVRADPLTRTTDANGEAFYTEFDGAQSTFGFPSHIDPPADSGYDSRLFDPGFNRFDLLDVQHVHDSHAPTLAFSQSPDGASGWWTGKPASVHVTASDPRVDTLACTVDGVAPRRLGVVAGTGELSADLAIRDEGRHAVACTALDRSGNSAGASTAVLIDLTNPLAPVLSADRAPDFVGATGSWWADAVTVTATDAGDPPLADGSAGSGVDPGSVPAPVTFTTSGRHVVSASVSDVAGNASRAARLTVHVDADAPSTALSCPASVRLGASANAQWDDDDAESGLVGSHHGRVALDTATPGLHTAGHTATDRVGHTATSSCSYTVD